MGRTGVKHDSRPAVQRFWARTRKPESDTQHDQCWLYIGPLTPDGYGQISSGGVTMTAHVFAYTLLVGPVPDGKQIDHVKERGCTHRNCVNPEHLEPVTSKENTLRGGGPTAKNARKTHCPRGHAYEADNIYRRADGSRECRICRALPKQRRAPLLEQKSA